MTGRKPLTAEQKRIVGSREPINHRRPKVVRGALRCPEYFGDAEKAVWDETLAVLPEGVESPAYRQLLITFCGQVVIRMQAMGELRRQAEDHRKEDGTTAYLTVETERGWVKNPLITVIDSCAKNIRSLASELGLTPIGRERLRTGGEEKPDKGKEESPLRKFLDQKKQPDTEAVQ